MRRRLVGGGALLAVAWLAGAGQAQADNDTFFVDSTGDSAADTACFGEPGNCSLRGAFTLADDADPDGDVDTIILNITPFDGVETVAGEATITMAGAGLSTDEDLNIQANCSVTAPCAGIDGPPGDIAIRVQDGDFSMRGVAVFDSLTGLQHSNTGDSAHLTNNYFGLKLDGTVDGNTTGLFIAGPKAEVGAVNFAGNVIAGNGVGMRIFGNAAQTSTSSFNRFGVKADGTAAPNTSIDIDIAGNVSNQAPSDVDIGPSTPNATPACDEGCNVIAAAGMNVNPGISLRGTLFPNETSTANDVTIQNNHIGVNAAGTAGTAWANGILAAVGDADNVILNGNHMAGGVYGLDADSGADNLLAEANIIGSNRAGTAVIDATSGSSINVDSSSTGGADIINNTIAVDGPVDPMTVVGDGAEIASNHIGLAGVEDSGGLLGVNVSGSNHLIQGNTVDNASIGIFAEELTGAEIKDNVLGELGPLAGSGILIDEAVGNSTGNAIGSNDPALANEFGDIADNAITLLGDGNDGNQILANLGGPGNGPFVDLGGDGPGNGDDGPNQGVSAPKVKKITAKAILGTAGPSGQVRVYRSGSPKGDFPAELKKLVGTQDVKPDGTWKLKPAGGVKKSWVITANQTDAIGNGSELSKGKQRR